MAECQWLNPVLVGQFEFLEWTGENHLRHEAARAHTIPGKPVWMIGDNLVSDCVAVTRLGVRILTDGYCFTTVPEILVDPEYQVAVIAINMGIW